MADDTHKILQGHDQDGFSFVPKILEGRQLRAVSYVRAMIPELCWLAVLNSQLGNERAAEIVHAVASELTEAQKMPRTWFPAITCCGQLSADLKKRVIEKLTDLKMINDIRTALDPFVQLYPEFPGQFLTSGSQSTIPSKLFLPNFKRILQQLYDPESPETVFMCALAIYATFALDMLRVDPSVSLSKFPEVENYPHTEISIRVAASVRSTCLMLVGSNVVEPKLFDWLSYFWNTGLLLEPIDWSAMENTRKR